MKSIFVSRTFWWNLLSGIGMFLALPDVMNILPEHIVKYLVLLNAAINIALRYVTTQSVSMTGDAT